MQKAQAGEINTDRERHKRANRPENNLNSNLNPVFVFYFQTAILHHLQQHLFVMSNFLF